MDPRGAKWLGWSLIALSLLTTVLVATDTVAPLLLVVAIVAMLIGTSLLA